MYLPSDLKFNLKRKPKIVTLTFKITFPYSVHVSTKTFKELYLKIKTKHTKQLPEVISTNPFHIWFTARLHTFIDMSLALIQHLVIKFFSSSLDKLSTSFTDYYVEQTRHIFSSGFVNNHYRIIGKNKNPINTTQIFSDCVQ